MSPASYPTQTFPLLLSPLYIITIGVSIVNSRTLLQLKFSLANIIGGYCGIASDNESLYDIIYSTPVSFERKTIYTYHINPKDKDSEKKSLTKSVSQKLSKMKCMPNFNSVKERRSPTKYKISAFMNRLIMVFLMYNEFRMSRLS